MPRNRGEMIDARYRKYFEAIQTLKAAILRARMLMLRIDEGYGWDVEANDGVLEYLGAAYTSDRTSLEVKCEAEKALWLLTPTGRILRPMAG